MLIIKQIKNIPRSVLTRKKETQREWTLLNKFYELPTQKSLSKMPTYWQGEKRKTLDDLNTYKWQWIARGNLKKNRAVTKWNILSLKWIWGNLLGGKLLEKITTSAKKKLTLRFFLSFLLNRIKRLFQFIVILHPEERWHMIHETTHELHFINSLLGFIFMKINSMCLQ